MLEARILFGQHTAPVESSKSVTHYGIRAGYVPLCGKVLAIIAYRNISLAVEAISGELPLVATSGVFPLAELKTMPMTAAHAPGTIRGAPKPVGSM